MTASLFSDGHNSGGAFRFVDCLGEQLVAVREKQRWSIREPGLDNSCGANRFPRADGRDAQQPVVLAPAFQRTMDGLFLIGSELRRTREDLSRQERDKAALVFTEFRKSMFG